MRVALSTIVVSGRMGTFGRFPDEVVATCRQLDGLECDLDVAVKVVRKSAKKWIRGTKRYPVRYFVGVSVEDQEILLLYCITILGVSFRPLIRYEPIDVALRCVRPKHPFGTRSFLGELGASDCPDRL